MASTLPPNRDAVEPSFPSSNPDSSTLSLESSFRLEPAYPNEGVECEKHPKGKRKRTTTQDKAILEAAYNSNPKPDKAARLDIVTRVSLNEKEVQIWFQNRRQNDRRKSRPLSPQEIAALRYGGGVQVISAEPVQHGSQAGGEQSQETRGEAGAVSGVVQQPSTPGHVGSRRASQSSPEGAQGGQSVILDAPLKSEGDGSDSDTLLSSQKGEAEGDSQILSHSVSSSIGYLSNRWNFGNPFSTSSTFDRAAEDSFRHVIIFAFVAPVLTVRLSLSLEGKAELVASQPSPPRPVPLQLPVDADTLPPVRTHRTLHRSRSAIDGVTLPPISTLTAHLPPQLKRGRSRDVHAWESCCEADTRDELTKQAENESSGSAVAAISLLRSSSSSSLNSLLSNDANSGILRSNSTKRNAPPARGASAKKAKFGRASSSVARMQSVSPLTVEKHTNIAAETPVPAKKPYKGGIISILSPSGDSDKENWSPGSDGNPLRRRPMPEVGPIKSADHLATSNNPRRVGRVLGEQNGLKKPTFLGNRAQTSPMPRQKGARHGGSPLMIFEDGGRGSREGTPGCGRERRDNEVERFMRGEVSPSKKPDLDCIAGLLSLSQGNWR
ncbi:hypothetical protein DL762_007641 [Monosporascus cannonballus]|uniref:Homeobox domain-containing protein n=1 Tax=Monosporascus cannonballus TaxID=155416 RepID=A0ABY0GZ33_9PEZI|nr:hypothetical protein DL762_007641 [Monosporascus cannonballus]